MEELFTMLEVSLIPQILSQIKAEGERAVIIPYPDG